MEARGNIPRSPCAAAGGHEAAITGCPLQDEIDEAYKQLARQRGEPVDAVTPYTETVEAGAYGPSDFQSRGERARRAIGRLSGRSAAEIDLAEERRAQQREARVKSRARKAQEKGAIFRLPTVTYEEVQL